MLVNKRLGYYTIDFKNDLVITKDSTPEQVYEEENVHHKFKVENVHWAIVGSSFKAKIKASFKILVWIWRKQ